MYGENHEGGVRAAVVWDIQALGSSRVSAGLTTAGLAPTGPLSCRGEKKQFSPFHAFCIGKQIIQASGQTKARGSVGVGVSYSIGNGTAGHGGFLETHTRPWESRGSQTLTPASKAER